MPKTKKSYLVVECPNCKRLLLATSDKRTRTCVYCERRLIVEDARVMSRSEKAEEARLALQELKIQERRAKSSASNLER